MVNEMQALEENLKSISETTNMDENLFCKARCVLSTIPKYYPFPSITKEDETLNFEWKHLMLTFKITCNISGFKVRLKDSPAIIIEQDYNSVTGFTDIIRYFYRACH